jgi:hypothetical protein
MSAQLPIQNVEDEMQAACVRYADEPKEFIRWVFDWGQGELSESDGPDVWQADVMDEIGAYCQAIARGENPGPLQLAVASGYGIGKSALVAWLIQWFMSCRPNPQIVVTANTEAQLLSKTWRTLSRWHKLMANLGKDRRRDVHEGFHVDLLWQPHSQRRPLLRLLQQVQALVENAPD